jgi:hypothetical protein
MRPIPPSLRRLLGIAVLLIAPLFPAFDLRAQDDPSAQDAHKKELSESVAAELGKLRALAEAKDYKGIVHLLDTLIPTAGPESFDLAVMSQIKGQVLLADAQYAAAAAPLEKSIQLGEPYGYLDQNTLLSSHYTLSQLYSQQAVDVKDPAEKNDLYEKAYNHIDRWLKASPAPSAEKQLFAASIRYNQATLDPAHIDLDKIRQCLAVTEKSLYLNSKVNTQTYVLMLAALQQLGDTRAAADIFELLVQREPQNPTYWQQLLASYYALAGAAKKDGEIRGYNLRALITYERAQSHGLIDTPRDHFSVVALYFNLQQFARGSAMLSKGLQDGTIENTRKNWELLSFSYQQQHEDERAKNALIDATKVFPTDGQLEFSLGQLYFAQDQADEAYEHLKAAAAKGNLDKPGQAYVFLAYVAYQLRRFDDAAKWAAAAADKPDVKKEDLARLNRAINNAVKDRETTQL